MIKKLRLGTYATNGRLSLLHPSLFRWSERRLCRIELGETLPVVRIGSIPFHPKPCPSAPNYETGQTRLALQTPSLGRHLRFGRRFARTETAGGGLKDLRW